jgi:hypothetical protein
MWTLLCVCDDGAGIDVKPLNWQRAPGSVLSPIDALTAISGKR